MQMRGTFVFDPEVVGLKEIKEALSALKIDKVQFNMSVEREAKPKTYSGGKPGARTATP